MDKQPLILLGAGGHCRSCIDIIECEAKYEIEGLVGTSNEIGSFVLGYEILAEDSQLGDLFSKRLASALIAIGQIKTADPRKKLYKKLVALGVNMAIVISPTAKISDHSKLEAGCVVMHGAIINACVSVGANCIINSRALLEHDVKVADHCHISTGAILNGGVSVEEGSFVGSGAIVLPGVKIGANSVVGAGVVVDRDTKSCEIVRRPNHA